MAHQKPHGGGPRLGDAAGEPGNSPRKSKVVSYGGAPTHTGGLHELGERVVGANGSGSVYPPVYGGGKKLGSQRSSRSVRGSGDKTGAP